MKIEKQKKKIIKEIIMKWKEENCEEILDRFSHIENPNRFVHIEEGKINSNSNNNHNNK